jgi:hypothetical protein
MKIQLELVPCGHHFTLRDESRPLRVAHFDSKLSSILLRSCLENDDARHRQNPDDSSNEHVHHFMKCREILNAAHPIAGARRGTQTHKEYSKLLRSAPRKREEGSLQATKLL